VWGDQFNCLTQARIWIRVPGKRSELQISSDFQRILDCHADSFPFPGLTENDHSNEHRPSSLIDTKLLPLGSPLFAVNPSAQCPMMM